MKFSFLLALVAVFAMCAEVRATHEALRLSARIGMHKLHNNTLDLIHLFRGVFHQATYTTSRRSRSAAAQQGVDPAMAKMIPACLLPLMSAQSAMMDSTSAATVAGQVTALCEGSCFEDTMKAIETMRTQLAAAASASGMKIPPRGTFQVMKNAVCIKDDDGGYCLKKLVTAVTAGLDPKTQEVTLSKFADSQLNVICGSCGRGFLAGAEVAMKKVMKDVKTEADKAVKAPASMPGKEVANSGSFSVADEMEGEDAISNSLQTFEMAIRMMCIKANGADGKDGGYCLPKISTVEETANAESASMGLVLALQDKDPAVVSDLCTSGCLSKFVSIGAQLQRMGSDRSGDMAFTGRMEKAVKFSCMPDNKGFCMSNFYKSLKSLRQKGCFLAGAATSCNSGCRELLDAELQANVSPCCVAEMIRATTNDASKVLDDLKNCTKSFKTEVVSECAVFKGTKTAKGKKRLNMDCQWAKDNFETIKPKLSADFAAGLGVPTDFVRSVAIESCGSVNLAVEVQSYDDTQTTNLASALSNSDVTMTETEATYSASGKSMYAPSAVTGTSSATTAVVSAVCVAFMAIAALLL